MLTMTPTEERSKSLPGSLQLSWVTVAVFAVVLALVDGFWATSLRGAVGATKSIQEPFAYWLRSSTLMLNLYVLAVAVALLVARRLVGQSRTALVKPAVAGLLIVVLSTAVGIAGIGATSAYDYRLQSQHLEQMFLIHPHADGLTSSGAAPVDATPTGATSTEGCVGLCAAQRQTLAVHVRAIRLVSVVLLLTNIVLVLFVLVFRGDHLWRRRSPVVARTVSAELVGAEPA
jgi:hypothetical protein